MLIRQLILESLIKIRDVIFPPVCSFCDTKIFDDYPMKGVCKSCLAKIPFRTGDMVRIKCLEEKSTGNINTDRSCKWNIDVIVACHYTENIRKSLIAMKFYDAAYMKHAFGNIMNHIISRQRESFDGIIPIPLHRKRKIERGYNQAALIAGEVSELSGIPLIDDCLIRSKNTRRQSEMNYYSDRIQNVNDAFQCINPEKIAGKKILLLDDILTSGETMICAAGAIKKAIDDYVRKSGTGQLYYEIIGFVLASSRK
ncbi:MAG: ComF family protein [Saccharofermentanales bacterium]